MEVDEMPVDKSVNKTVTSSALLSLFPKIGNKNTPLRLQASADLGKVSQGAPKYEYFLHFFVERIHLFIKHMVNKKVL